MSLLALLKTVAHNNFSASANTPKQFHTTVPLGLTQGSIVSLPDLDLVLAQANGSIVPDVPSTQTVKAVGITVLFGLTIYNCYLSDGKTFIQLITDKNQPSKVTSTRLFVSRDEILPQSIEDWEFWLDKYSKDLEGNFVRDSNGIAIVEEAGLIGFPEFQIDGTPPIIFAKSWSTGTKSRVTHTENIIDCNGITVVVKHESAEYFRALEDGSTNEHLFVTVSEVKNASDSSVNIFVGIDIDAAKLKIITSNA